MLGQHAGGVARVLGQVGGAAVVAQAFLQAAGALGLIELRAVTAQARHVLTPGDNGWPDDVALAAQFIAAQPRARADVQRAIRDGLPAEAASAELLHRVWLRVALALGLRYWREWA